MACRSRSRSPEDASEQVVDDIYLDGEIDFEFPMLTDEDIDCIVQDISDAGDAPLGSVEKPLAIDAIQKHVEESLLFLDEEKSTFEKSQIKTVASGQKNHFVFQKIGSDHIIMQDVDDSSNTGEPQKKSSLILKQENINDASLSDEVQKDKTGIEIVTIKNKVDSLLEFVKEETSKIPKPRMETNDVILSLEDNPKSDSVLKDVDTAMNDPQEETNVMSEQSSTVKLVVSQHNSPSECVVKETDTTAVVNVSLEQENEIPHSKKNNIVSLEHNPTSDIVINELNKDIAMDSPQEVTSDITEQIHTSKVNIFQEHKTLSDSTMNESDTDEVPNVSLDISDTVLNDAAINDPQEKKSDISEQMDTDAVENVSLEQESEISQLTDGKNAIIVSLEDNRTSDGILNKVDKATDVDDPQEDTCGISQQIDTSEVNVSPKDDPPSDSAINEMDTNAVVNVSLKQKSEIPQPNDTKKANIESLEDKLASNSVLNKVDKDTEKDDPQDDTSDISQQIDRTSAVNVTAKDNPQESEISQLPDTKKANIESLEDSPTSCSVLNKVNTDSMINDSENKPSELSEQIDANKVRNASQEDNPLSDNMLTETNTDEEIINDQKKTSDISMVLHEGISRSDSLLDETDADVTMNYDSQEELGDNSKQMITNEIGNVSQEKKSPSDSLLYKTDLDAKMDDTQEGVSDIPQQNDEIYDNNVLQEKNSLSEVVLDETGADGAINGPQDETSDISDQIDINEISNISQEDVLNETDTGAAMNVSQEISEQTEKKKTDNIYKYKILNETDTDVSNNDSQEEISDISIIDSKEISIVSHENVPSDSVLNKTDTDVAMNDSQEENNDMKTDNIDDSYISEKDKSLNSELDKTDAVLHAGCETDHKSIETSGNCQENHKSIKKIFQENCVTEPQKDRILVDSKEIDNKTDERTQGIETNKIEDYKLHELESNVEKSGLPENETQVKKEINRTEPATQKSTVKELVWEIKSIKHEGQQQGKKDILQKERSQEQNVTENPTKKNPLVRAAPLEDVTECPPVKRPRFQPVWTTNPLNDEDKTKAEQATCSDKTGMDVNTANDTTAEEPPLVPYVISQEAKKQLQTWILKSGLGQPNAIYMLGLVNAARWNKAVLRMAPIPKDYKPMDVFRVISDQTKAYDKGLAKNIQFIHINKHDNFNSAYIKWRDMDKLLVVKAYQILVNTTFTVDGLVKQPLFIYDDRSIIDWNENDRPILKQKIGDKEIPITVSTPALTPVVTPVDTVAATASATPVAKPVTATVAKPRPRNPPPLPPFINGEINFKDRQTFGLSSAFMEYYNLKPPIVCFVFAKNLDMTQSVEKYRRIFSAAGDIMDIEIMPPLRYDEQLNQQSMTLRITFNHGLEAVQAVSMFHEQILFDRVTEVEMGHIGMKKKPLKIEGFNKNIRSNIEISKLRSSTKVQLDNFKDQISTLRQKLAAATFKMEQAKKDEEKRRCKEEKKQMQSLNESQNKQASMDAVSAITMAIASSVQANVMGMLGIQPNQQGQNIKQNTSSAPVNNQPGSMPQNQNTSKPPVKWTANESTATALPNQNMPVQTSMQNAFQNLGRELQTYQNPQDPYSSYANMQQAYYAQYGYSMDPTLMQANAYFQPGTSYMQPVPTIDTSNMTPMKPKTQSMPTITSNEPVPSKPSIPTQSKVHTQSKTVFSPLTTNKNVTVYDIQKPAYRFDVPPANVGSKNAAPSRFDVPPAKVGQTTKADWKVSEIQRPIPSISKPTVKTAFNIQKPIVPAKVTKPASINIKIPSVLPETVPLVVQNPRTLEENKVQRKFIKLARNMPAEPWINKQIRDMRKNSKSPERIRKSPEKIKSPDRSQKTLPKATLPTKAVRRISRSPERKKISRSPERRNSRSPIRRRSRSVERRTSRSPIRRRSRSPIRRRSRSPIRRRSRSTERRRLSRSPIRRTSRSPIRRRSRSTDRRRMSRSPIRIKQITRRLSRSPKRRMSRSPIRRKSRSPARRISRSPKRRLSRSPVRRKSRSPVRRRSRSPKRGISRSPKRRISKSPIRRKSRSPVRRFSKSPVRKISRTPLRLIGRSPVRRINKSPVRLSLPPTERKRMSRSHSSELGPKPTPRPAYEPDGASRDVPNLDIEDRTDNYNYIQEMEETERELTNTSITFSFLPPSVTTEDLTEKMGEIGELLAVQAFGMGKALVVFKYRHDAETCIEMYNLAKVDGQTIEVRWASIE